MEEPSVAIKLLEVLSGRLRCTSDQVEDLSFGELSVRMAKVLLRFAELQGTISTPRPRVTVTQKELGQIVGLSRERTNWYLRDWERAGYLTLKKRGCILENTTIIQNLAHPSKH
jgi:CRP-like cAMP-binding protein